MLTDRGSALELDVVDDGWLDGVTVLHLPAYSLTAGRLAETSAEVARRARAAGVLTSVDASSIAVLEEYGAMRFLALLADLQPDVLLTNDDEARLLDLRDRPPDGVGLLVVHRGRGAATAADFSGTLATVSPATLRDAADTTGAGDAFAAGFLPALQQGVAIDRALAAGHACAAGTLDVPGASVKRVP